MSQPPAGNPLTTDSAVGHWVLDEKASTIGIANKGLWGLVTVHVRFAEVTGSANIGPGGALTGVVTIVTASLNSKNKIRDGHLRSAGFLAVERYPEITVRVPSTTVTGAEVRLPVELTVKETTEPLEVVAHVTAATEDTITGTVEVVLDRHRFGVTGNTFGSVVGLTTVTADLVFRRPTAS
jgi:polyisoprenoid-binding protein YceI